MDTPSPAWPPGPDDVPPGYQAFGATPTSTRRRADGPSIAAGVMVLIEVLPIALIALVVVMFMSEDDDEFFFISPDSGIAILAVLGAVCGLLIASAVGMFMAKTWGRVIVIVLHALWIVGAFAALVSDGELTPVAAWPVVVLLLAAIGRNRPG